MHFLLPWIIQTIHLPNRASPSPRTDCITILRNRRDPLRPAAWTPWRTLVTTLAASVIPSFPIHETAGAAEIRGIFLNLFLVIGFDGNFLLCFRTKNTSGVTERKVIPSLQRMLKTRRRLRPKLARQRMPISWVDPGRIPQAVILVLEMESRHALNPALELQTNVNDALHAMSHTPPHRSQATSCVVPRKKILGMDDSKIAAS